MRFREEKKSHKLAIFLIVLFVAIGTTFIYFAVKNEKEPQIIGQKTSDMQSLIDVEAAQSNSQSVDVDSKTYKIDDKDLSDSSNSKFKGSIHVPVISIDGQKLDSVNSDIEKKYSELFNTLKDQNKSSNNSFTYKVSYNSYDNKVGAIRLLSITIHERIVDNQSGNTTYEKVSSYNIDFKDNGLLKGTDVIADALGSDCKDKIKQQIKDYVVNNGYMKASDYNYSFTGLENFYIKDGNFHIIFNKGELVDKYIDITIK